MRDHILTVLEGTNAEAIRDIFDFYVSPDALVLDVTCGEGKFYEKVSNRVIQSDIKIVKKNREQALQADCTLLPYRDGFADVVIIDLPYQQGSPGGIYTSKYDTIGTVLNIYKIFEICDQEFLRVLKKEGILVVKIMDTVMSGKQRWVHSRIKTILIGFDLEDLFIYVFTRSFMRAWNWKRMIHAKKNHAYFMVFKVKGTKCIRRRGH